jgi:crotonobetainyl-CoA:carnitine CoA-transferase CaiB-like acyl-CoA transferase
VARVAPHIGEHSEQVLMELGYDDHEIARLVADGVVSQSRASKHV